MFPSVLGLFGNCVGSGCRRAFASCSVLVPIAIATATGNACAKLVEEQISLPVQVVNGAGKQVRHAIVVTLFRDDAAKKPYPVLLLNHGRSVSAAERQALGRVRLSVAARWLTEFGFLVAVPTRLGYGVTGGDDVEDSGACDRKNYPPAFQAAAAQTLEVLKVLRERRDVAQDRAVVMGQSFGGTTAITLASLQPAAVQAAINFAGGGGGNPQTHAQDPCSQLALERLFRDYGKTSRMPTLWIYSENDMYFGPTLPKTWFAAFQASGGVGEYVLFPPLGDNGHLLFSRAPEQWQPRVQQFLQSLGYSRRP